MGRVLSPAVDESGHSRSQRFNVGNLRDTGHSAEAPPPAAMAEQETASRFSTIRPRLTSNCHRVN